MNLKPLFLLALLQQICSNLIGIDFGSEYFKVSMVKSGRPFSLVENYQSKTSTPNFLSFKDNEVMFGSDALSKKIRFSEHVFHDIKEFIGKKYNDPSVKKFLDHNMIHFEISQDDVQF